MTVKQLMANAELNAVCLPQPDRLVSGAYVGDLLSWVMGRAAQDNAWITIMSNINVVAVASLADVSCIILAENVTAEPEVLETAKLKNINILSTHLTAFEAAVKISGMV